MKRTIDIMAAETLVESWRAEVRELRTKPTTLAKGLQFPDACLMASVYELCADQLTALIKKSIGAPLVPAASQKKAAKQPFREAVMPVGKELPDATGVWWRMDGMRNVQWWWIAVGHGVTNMGEPIYGVRLELDHLQLWHSISMNRLHRGGWLPVSAPLGESERCELERLRKLVYELETNCDPSSNVRDIVALRENCKSLESELTQARAEAAEAKRELQEVRGAYRISMEAQETAEAERDRLTALINCPHNGDWFEGVRIEAAHQQERWGTAHDEGKEPQDWFWLIGYLAGKCLRSCISGDIDKAKHHTISTAAVMLNWYRRISGGEVGAATMRPGIASPDAALVPQAEKPQ